MSEHDWIGWGGGMRPVDLKQLVDYRRRETGDTSFTGPADRIDWHHRPLIPKRDIVWYRLAAPAQVEQSSGGWIDYQPGDDLPGPNTLLDVVFRIEGHGGGRLLAGDVLWDTVKRYRALPVCVREDEPTEQSSGGDNDYWVVGIVNPKRMEPARVECEDVIQALGMTFGEGEAFKAIWRGCAARLGNGKPGDTALRNAEKVVHYGEYMKRDAK